MKAWLGGTSSPVLGLPSGPSVTSGSSGLSGTKTVPPLVTVWSTPWSKNWPKNVNSELNGGERPVSVETFGMKSVWCSGVQPTGSVGAGGSAVQAATPLAFWVLTGWRATATGGGLVLVWCKIRVVMAGGFEAMVYVYVFVALG